MEKMNIDISIYGQGERSFRSFYILLGIVGVIYFALLFIFPEWRIKSYYFTWIAFLPGIIEVILYKLGRKKKFADSLPYLRLNAERIEDSNGGPFTKPDVCYWHNVKAIEVTQFEVNLTTTGGTKKKINLISLSDDNRQRVKEFVLTLKRDKGL